MERRIEQDYEVDDITTSQHFPYCHEATDPLTDGWRLFYFETKRWHHQKQTHINGSQPFRKAYTSPMPKYRSDIKVCDNGTAKRCQPKPDDFLAFDSDECVDYELI